MVKILLVGINAKYIQTNLAIRLLSAWADEYSQEVQQKEVQVSYAEWNINQSKDLILQGIFKHQADMVLFSVYIWNKELTLALANDLKKIMPQTVIGLGGPEVSWSADSIFTQCRSASFIMSGEGEQTLTEVISAFAQKKSLEGIKGLYLNKNDDVPSVYFTGNRPLIPNLGKIPFPYKKGFTDIDPENRIIYYESSRGCPFSCAYCLSSIERSVRYYPLERVFQDLSWFLERKVPLVKFVDRTFNLEQKRYMAIWEFIRDNYNNCTTFHFEITATLLSDEVFVLLDTMPEGALQFEIGIQSIHPETLQKIHRQADLSLLEKNILRIPKTIHTHVDLIAGLPEEDFITFGKSFNFAFALNAGMVQLGFLKILSGTEMENIGKAESEYRWSSTPPYEVLVTPKLSFWNLMTLKEIDHLVDVLYNSGLMVNTLRALVKNTSAFDEFIMLAEFVKTWFEDGDLFLPRKPMSLFDCLAGFLKAKNSDPTVFEWLRYDFLLQGKPGAFPTWFERRYLKAAHEAGLEVMGLLKEGESKRLAYAHSEYEEFCFFDRDVKEAFLFVYGQERKSKVKVLKM